MIYPIGYSTLQLTFDRADGNVLCADGVAITDADGWVDVRMPDESVADGAPRVVSVRLQVERGGGTRWFFTAETIATAERPYPTLFELMASAAPGWLRALGPALDREIARRVAAGRRAHSGLHAAVPSGAGEDPAAGNKR